MFAYDYPVLGVFWSMMFFFLWVIWLMMLFRVFADIFRTHDMGGFAKTLWVIFVIIVPFFGVFVYLIANGRSMAQRDMDSAKAQDQAMQAYVRDVAGSGGSADELAKLAELKAQGVLTDAEFAQQKAKILA